MPFFKFLSVSMKDSYCSVSIGVLIQWIAARCWRCHNCTMQCNVGWLPLGKQNWFPYEYDDSILIILRVAATSKRVWLCRTDERRNGGKKMCSIYCSKFECKEISQTFAKVTFVHNLIARRTTMRYRRSKRRMNC